MKILMVCLGNICRSPMADGLLRKKVSDHDLAIDVDSAGTGDWHVGQAPDERMRATAKSNGLSIDELRGRQFVQEDYDLFDRIYVMDQSNYENVIKLARSDEDITKVDLFLNLSHPGEDMEVPDPYFGGEEGFQHVYDLIDDATDRLINEFKSNNGER